MKILLITLRADHGGGPYHVDILINHLSSSFKIFLACPNDRPYFDKWQLNHKVTDIFNLPHRKFDIKKLLLLNKYIKNNSIDIIHSHGKGAGIYGRLLKILNPKLKIIHTLHGLHISEYSFLQKTIYINIERFLSLLTNSFINVSYGEQKLCLEYKLFLKSKSNVIYNGIKKLILYNKAKKQLNLNEKFVITTISRFDYPKNMFYAYEIAKKFKNNKNITFLWLGDGSDKKPLEKQAKNENVNIIFTGFVEDIPLYLSETNIYLSTSRWEGLPYALIEAQSLGIPIVATDVVGNNEVVIDGDDGFLYTSIDEACQKIDQLIEDKTLYQKFHINAKQNFNNKFNIKIMIKKTEKIYKDFR